MEQGPEPIQVIVSSIARMYGLGVGIYLALGVLFAIPFLWRGAGRLDALARTGSWGFRLAILPGVIAFWVPLAIRWAQHIKNPDEPSRAPRTPHTLRARRTEKRA